MAFRGMDGGYRGRDGHSEERAYGSSSARPDRVATRKSASRREPCSPASWRSTPTKRLFRSSRNSCALANATPT